MMSNKRFITFVFAVLGCILFNPTLFGNQLLTKLSSTEFAVSTVDKTYQIKCYTISDGKPKLIDEFNPKFPDTNYLVESIDPMGIKRKRIDYQLKTRIGNTYYFVKTGNRKIIEFDRNKRTFSERIVKLPEFFYIHKINKVDDSFIVSNPTVLNHPKKKSCEKMIFLKKNLNWEDTGCFGDPKDIMNDLDFPDGMVSETRKRAAVYFRKSGDYREYNTKDGTLIEQYTLDTQKVNSFEKENVGTPDFLFENGPSTVLLKYGDDVFGVFCLENKSWVLKKTIPKKIAETAVGDAIIIDKYLVQLDADGKITVDPLDF